jgi:protein TonB
MQRKLMTVLLIVVPLVGIGQSARKTNKLLKQEYASKRYTSDSLAILHDVSNRDLRQLGELRSQAFRSCCIVLNEVTGLKGRTISLFQKSSSLGVDKTLTFTIQSIEMLRIPTEYTLSEKFHERDESFNPVRKQSFKLDLEKLNVREQNKLLSETIDAINEKIEEYSLFNQKFPRFVSLFNEDYAWLTSEEEKWRIETAALELKLHELEQVLKVAKDNYAKNGPKGFNEQYSDVFPDVFSEIHGQWGDAPSWETIGEFESFTMRDGPAPPPVSNEKDIVYTLLDESAEFPGGRDKLQEFLKVNLIYPKEALELGLEGKCYLELIVSDSGKISTIKVLRGVPDCPECDTEAIRLIKSMPDWLPGKNNGKPVNSVFNLPVAFKLP